MSQFLIFGKHHHCSNAKLAMQCTPHLINVATLPCKMKCLLYYFLCIIYKLQCVQSTTLECQAFTVPSCIYSSSLLTSTQCRFPFSSSLRHIFTYLQKPRQDKLTRSAYAAFTCIYRNKIYCNYELFIFYSAVLPHLRFYDVFVTETFHMNA